MNIYASWDVLQYLLRNSLAAGDSVDFPLDVITASDSMRESLISHITQNYPGYVVVYSEDTQKLTVSVPRKS